MFKKKNQWSNWPVYTKEDLKFVTKSLKSNKIVAWGDKDGLFKNSTVKKFEMGFSKYVNSKYAQGVGNATQGLHLALASLGIGLGDEVIVPVYSFISSASCILMQNATPVFVDINEESLMPDLHEIKKKISKKTKALIIVNMFGYAENLYEISEFCKKMGIYLIEDASHGHGSFYKKKHAGTFGDIGVFSFNERKVLPAGDGGILITNNRKIAKKIYRLRSFGDKELSYNYRLGELNAAIALNKLKELNKQNRVRNKIAHNLANKLNGKSFLEVKLPKKNTKCSYYRLILKCNKKIPEIKIKKFVSFMNRKNIPISITWKPLNLHPHFNNKDFLVNKIKKSLINKLFKSKNKLNFREQKFPVADRVLYRILELPINPPIGELQIHNFVNLLIKFTKFHKLC